MSGGKRHNLQGQVVGLETKNIHLENENERLHSIIKEVREYIEEKEKNNDNWIDYELLIEPIRIKEILDKENKE